MNHILTIIFFSYLLSTNVECSAEGVCMINASDWDNWVYMSLSQSSEIDPGNIPENDLGWDMAFKRYHFRTNSGLSGNGNGGAYVDSVNTWINTPSLYNNLLQVPNEAFFERDSVVYNFYERIDLNGDGVIQESEHIMYLPGISNPALETWGQVDQNNNYEMNFSHNQLIVRSADGNQFYKLWANGYRHPQTGDTGYITIYYDEIAECADEIDECGKCGGPGAIYECGCQDLQHSETFIDFNLDGSYDIEEEGFIDLNSNGIYDSVICDCIGSICGCENQDDCTENDLFIGDNLYPEKFKLYQNYPNPFNPNTYISYSILIPASISIDIFDINGKHIFSIKDGLKESGDYKVRWDGRGIDGQKVSSGIYIYRLMSNGIEIDNKKMMLLY